jgi:dTMP kinase
LQHVRAIIDIAVGHTRPDLTLFLKIPQTVSEERLRSRQATMPFIRDRMEEADRAFFERVAHGYDVIAESEPERVHVINAAATVVEVQSAIWRLIAPLVATRGG